MSGPEYSQTQARKLLIVGASGKIRHLPQAALAELFKAGDLIIANDAGVLPASLEGRHVASGEKIEVRLAAWIELHDPTRFVALAFGAGDHRMRTEDRAPPPTLRRGDRLILGPLVAIIEDFLGHPRLFALRFLAERAAVMPGLASHGRPIQYSHAPTPFALWDVWTKIAADPIAFEPPSAGFALDWRTLAAWRRRGVGFATLAHAAGLSSTGDLLLDERLPFDEAYRIPERTAVAVRRTRARGGCIVAIGTSVVRALESAANGGGGLDVGIGVARGRIGRRTAIRIADAILTGVHQPGESHYEMIRAFAEEETLERVAATLKEHGYRGHEFGDFLLITRKASGRDLCEARSAGVSFASG